jgi:hypothetical protein
VFGLGVSDIFPVYSWCAWCRALLLPSRLLLVLDPEHKVVPDVCDRGTGNSAREVSLADLCIRAACCLFLLVTHNSHPSLFR